MTERIRQKALWLFLALLLQPFPCVIAQQKEASPRTEGRLFSDVHGRITITRMGDLHDEPMRHALPGRYATHGAQDAALLINPVIPPAIPLSEKAVVYLQSEESDRARYALPEKRPVLDQKDLQFRPRVLPVLVGTTVEFPNRDNLFHNVFSYSEPKEFDLGRYPRNDSRSVTFDKAGVVRVYCDIHSHMNANILVLSNPHFTTPDNDGLYLIPHVPEGKYTLVFWYDRSVVERRSVELKAGEPLRADFNF
jgi:plastocyanin